MNNKGKGQKYKPKIIINVGGWKTLIREIYVVLKWKKTKKKKKIPNLSRNYRDGYYNLLDSIFTKQFSSVTRL